MADQSPQEIIEGEVVDMLALEGQLQEVEAELMENPQFRKFIEMQRETQEKLAAFWKRVEARMIELDIKSIKGAWGSISVAERQNFNITIGELPSKFIKRVPDTTKIAASYKLEGKPPRGAEPYTTKYLTKRFKKSDEQ